MEKFGAKYNAILMSADELTSLTLDNFVDIMNIQTKIKRKLFYSIEQAKKWVLEDD